MVQVFTHDDCLGHITPPGHPERVERLSAVERGLSGLAVNHQTCPVADPEDILRCHPRPYVDRLRNAVPTQGWVMLDGDTSLSPGSFDAALRAVGGVCAAVDQVIAHAGRAFVAARPPGHHAERETAMGFCLFGSVAIGAMRAIAVHGLTRVAVLDFDVHHGNGTQDLLWDEPRIRFVSSHQMPLYPGSGYPSERGAHGQITNLPLMAGTDGREMMRVWQPVLEDLRQWAPELVIISAGFDAHRDDPLGGLNWRTADFARLTAAICKLADETCGGRVVSALEGGYDLEALADCVAAHVNELGKASE